MKCKECKIRESPSIDFYQCDNCQDVICHNHTHTSIKTGNDYCKGCFLLVGKRSKLS